MLRESIFKVAADPKKNHKLPKEKETVPYLNFSPLENSLAELKQKAEEHALKGHTFVTVKEAIEAAKKKAKAKDLIFIGGSTFVVADALTN